MLVLNLVYKLTKYNHMILKVMGLKPVQFPKKKEKKTKIYIYIGKETHRFCLTTSSMLVWSPEKRCDQSCLRSRTQNI